MSGLPSFRYLMNEARYLDPRSVEEASVSPILDSANIPLHELLDRVGELPPPELVIRVVGPDALASETVRLLREHGRKAIQIIKYRHGIDDVRRRLWWPNILLWQFEADHLFRNRRVGEALDLGCGGGRDAIFLASHDWKVVAVDHLPDAVERGQNLARRYISEDQQQRIEWQVADVLSPDYSPGGPFDLITCLFFFDRALIARAQEWLKPGGVLLVEAFTSVHQEQTGKPASPQRVVKPGEMRDLLSGMEIKHLFEGDHVRGHTCRVVARKR